MSLASYHCSTPRSVRRSDFFFTASSLHTCSIYPTRRRIKARVETFPEGPVRQPRPKSFRGGDTMNRTFVRAVLLVLAGAGAFGLAAAAPSAAVKDLPLQFRDDFKKGAGAWQPTDPSAWKVIETGQAPAYSQFRQSKYRPPYRSPLNFSL